MSHGIESSRVPALGSIRADESMRVGIFINSLPSFGGVFQYSYTLVSALTDDSRSGDELVVFSGVKAPRIERLLSGKGKKFVFLGPLRLGLEVLRKPSSKYLRMIFRYLVNRILKRASDSELHTTYLELVALVVQNAEIDLMLYPRVDFETFHNKVPFIVAVHDLQHRINPQFPEVSLGDLWEWREYFFLNACHNASAIFVDSGIGKEDVVNCYGTDPSKIVELPFLPPDYLSEDVDEDELKATRKKFSLPERYVFYPAQFWRHKNHRTIISALHHIKQEHGVRIPVVFCGGKVESYGEFEVVMRLADELGVRDQVHYLGYIDDKFLAPLYKMALTLVMPTAFGPTNIPILEAWKMGCPVITSNIRGCADQAADAAVLVDPFDPKDLARGIMKLHNDRQLRKRLANNGRKRLALWSLEQFKVRVRETISICLQRLKDGVKPQWNIVPIDEIKKTRPVIRYDANGPSSAIRPVQTRDAASYPRISVITPSFNCVKYIEDGIKSVLIQNYPNFEHIVVDAGSTDGTVDILKKYKHVRWISKKDGGQSDAMNKGFLMSTGDIIVYLNADDFFEPGVFFDAAERLEKEKGVYMVSGECNVAKPDGSVYVPAFVPKTDFYHMMFWWHAWFPINPSSYFYFREVQEAVDGYDMVDHYMMDYDFLLKASLKYKIHVVDRVWGNFRWLGDNKSATRPADLTRQSVSRKYFHHLSVKEKLGYFKHYLQHRKASSQTSTA